jgi:crossover junction endodeoxyribonuclease RuvC
MKPPTVTRRILGIDPGSHYCGFGIIEDTGNKLSCVTSGVISMGNKAELPQRLLAIFNNLSALVQQYRPQMMAVESVFHANHAKSALVLGHARGIPLLVAAQFKLEFFEYAPRAIKKGLTGAGNADKEMVQKMVRMLLRDSLLDKPVRNLSSRGDLKMDETDALAVAIYHAHINPWLKMTSSTL